MKRAIGVAVVIGLTGAHMASAIEYKKSVISGAGGITRSTFRSVSSRTTLGGSNTTTVTSVTPPKHFQFGDFDWVDRLGNKTLEQRVRDAEQKLYKLYFIRDVCRTLEDEITLSFEKKDIRDVMKQVSAVKDVALPFEVPDGAFIVEKSDVAGMPTDDFLNSVASVCGLALQYAPDKLVFVKVQKQRSHVLHL
ncbi:MAG: hypothetical protein HN919_06660 [Verrucomicrobia bacterium]|jgi:hypothetical protein|nr:hypothetical protein [Verrucomicrobiota bacterium]MBT7065964.1 hypothetical protein [Verrucomicrobiota bacterium]MBT7701150.1 hypothetical protein [Verrucomicrobiota bacterium]